MCACSISGDMWQLKGQGIFQTEGCFECLQSGLRLFFFFFLPHFIFAVEAFKRLVVAAKEYSRADRRAMCTLFNISLLMWMCPYPTHFPPNSLCPISILLGMLPESDWNMPQLCCGLEQPGLCLQRSGRNLVGHPPLWKGEHQPLCWVLQEVFWPTQWHIYCMCSLSLCLSVHTRVCAHSHAHIHSHACTHTHTQNKHRHIWHFGFDSCTTCSFVNFCLVSVLLRWLVVILGFLVSVTVTSSLSFIFRLLLWTPTFWMLTSI